MTHKVIRLTESQFNEMISMAVKGILKEGIDDLFGDMEEFNSEEEIEPVDDFEDDPDWYRDDVTGMGNYDPSDGDLYSGRA